MYIYTYEYIKVYISIEKCASLKLNLKKTGGWIERGGRSASPPKQSGNTYFHMQGAGLNVILKVYILHDMHLGNMWNVG